MIQSAIAGVQNRVTTLQMSHRVAGTGLQMIHTVAVDALG